MEGQAGKTEAVGGRGAGVRRDCMGTDRGVRWGALGKGRWNLGGSKGQVPSDTDTIGGVGMGEQVLWSAGCWGNK